MSAGCLVAVVGPSGVGKDSIMAGVVAEASHIQLVRRAITRAPELGGEQYDAMTPEAFKDAASEGAFCLHWGAHELLYGIPMQTLKDVQSGAVCIANLSRGALQEASRVFPKLSVLNITASPAALAERLKTRGREDINDIEKRLASAKKPLPEGLDVIEIRNDGVLEDAVGKALSAVQLVGG
ncbi:phosphonate metabolism protein/1,5-bisphosphokinase (PRPP-forming) PhnN [Lentibacter sp. XHP0401]|jgi:ribose 1,5-bisphosphokinase|uniref:phosphonate metabolism protein/1,5-bisphosphokinase (PRPP-forming) PhnN n=1 Tax=Lentibacter sp. XHP0401 TaxID=2984334 RepID=UPI0021E70E6B|nr:phosphonate metabolism protein/1,5-bisphosphokinase (PRPP-forming) PhnN [Lentibacter sp. XHP0401]MCV2892784.1 phosphonate metabolism protein/1,5-bisphosphokinase (PRPP-forming) PhnN [Lentibacter sp. XHP0401]